MKNLIILTFLLAGMVSCTLSRKLTIPSRAADSLTGSAYYQKVLSMSREDREKLARQEILSGNIPSFLKKFTRISIDTIIGGKKYKVQYFVLPDYLSIGSDKDFARIPLTPMSAQEIADSLHCFLPTRKMVDDIYRQAKVKLAPVPLLAFRDSAITFWHHQLIIEGQRQGRKGLIAGIKKDLVISGKLIHDGKPGKEAIYGWHLLTGQPIQPLYTGHVNWWVDYSHGIRLVYHTIIINGKPYDYLQVLKDPSLAGLLCDETFCDCYRYPY